MLKRIYNSLSHSIIKRRKKYFNFFFINFRAIKGKRVEFSKSSIFNQKTIISEKGKVFIGENCMFGFKPGGYFHYGYIELQPRYENSFIKIGNEVLINNNLLICCANYVEIGDKTLIGQGVCIVDFEAHGTRPDQRRNHLKIGSVIIGENVWIGNNVTILKNTVIGNNTIVAAGAVVSGMFPENVIIGGVPAKVIKKIDVE